MKTGLHKSQLAYILHEYAFHGKRGMYLFDDCSELIKQLAHAAYSTSILNLLLVIWLWKNFNECKYIILEKKNCAKLKSNREFWHCNFELKKLKKYITIAIQK